MHLVRADPALATVPIMAVTAYAAQGDDERMRAAGAQTYISKPISVMRFVEAVEALLDAGPIDAGPIEAGQVEAGPIDAGALGAASEAPAAIAAGPALP